MNKYLTRLITNILQNNIPARDNWMQAVKEVHDKEMQLWCFTKEQYYDAVFGGHLSNIHTIRRLWQFVQERNPSLRGETWAERQKYGGLVAQEVAESKYHQLDLFPEVEWDKNSN